MLENVKLRPNYNSYDNDIVSEFYNPVLRCCNRYDRATAYFSAKSIANISEGIALLYQNAGKIRFIISESIDEEEYEIIKNGYEKKELIYERLEKKIDNDRLSELDKINLSNLAYLIEHNIVEIKIAFKTTGIFHDKFGLMEDSIGNKIYFRGSNNETVAAIAKNYESFDVTCSWLASEFEKERIDIAEKQFDKLWNNNVDDICVIDVPQVIKMKLLSFNKGKLITEKEINEYIIQFDYNEIENRFIAKLGKKVNINIKNYLYKIQIQMYVDRIENNIVFFKDNLSYLKYRKIINYVKEYVKDEIEKNNFAYVTTALKFEEYMSKKDFKINERYELGKTIKEENIVLNKEIDISFKKFQEVLLDTMERRLKEKQLWNAFHIVKMKKSANFSVPGAGKTTIVYGAYAYLNYINKVKKLVVIGPKSSFLSWKNEFKLNFGAKKELKVCDIQTISKKELIENAYNSNLILINYESLPGLSKELKHILNEDCMLVFDEVHKIKGIEKVRAKVALEVSEKPLYKVVLTGTPIPNGYEDVYNMLNILYSSEYDDFFGFSPKELKNAKEYKADVINQKIYPFFCRTTKKDLKVPEPDNDIILKSVVSNEEEQLYMALKEKYKSNPFIYYIRMMQAISNPELLLKDLDSSEIQNMFLIDYEENDIIDKDFTIKDMPKITDQYIINLIHRVNNTGKFKLGIEKIKELVNEKKSVLVWGIFTGTLEKIQQELKNNNISAKVIDGKITDLKEREKIINEFLTEEIQVLIANPNTLAESVSLHKQCHDAIYFEYSFNYTHMAQSRDRINRLGLNENQYTRYYYAMCGEYDDKESIDRIIYNRLQEKHDMMLQAIESGELKSIKDNLNEDILKLLND